MINRLNDENAMKDNVKTEKSMLGFEVTLEDLGKKTRFPMGPLKELTVVIPSNKPTVFTLALNSWLHNYIIKVFHNSIGLAPAFNRCFRDAETEVVVLLADDMWLSPEIQKFFKINRGEFAMLETGVFPINGVQVIHRDDFWKVGGFNKGLKYGSVDDDFYSRAVLRGLKYIPIPLDLVKHVKHKKRAHTIYNAFNVLTDRANFLINYMVFFPKLVFKQDIAFRLMRFQLRTLVLLPIFFLKTLIMNKLREWWEVLGYEYY
jgi:glycosyltransferase involved in cell wall biosynthesis